MKHFVAISDTHMTHKEFSIPRCDFLVHSGDATNMGEKKEMYRFLNWFKEQDATHKIFIPGNHDIWAEEATYGFRKFCEKIGVITLFDENITLDGIKIHGSPYVPTFFDWAFMEPDLNLARRWELIDQDTQVLITHGPPYGILDRNIRGMLCGSQTLAKAVLARPNIKYHVFGHIHESTGTYKIDNTTFVNAAMQMNWFDTVEKNPMEFIVNES